MISNISTDIIIKAQHGDLKSFEDIVYYYEKKIFGYLLKLTRNKQDAEDLTQEVFLKIYKNLKSYQTDKKFSTWIFTIAKNSATDFFRKNYHKKEVYVLDDPNFPEPIKLESNHVIIKEIKHQKLDLHSAISKIKPIYQKVIKLFYLDGFNYKEISNKLEIPVNTVKTNIFRAKKILRDYL